MTVMMTWYVRAAGWLLSWVPGTPGDWLYERLVWPVDLRISARQLRRLNIRVEKHGRLR